MGQCLRAENDAAQAAGRRKGAEQDGRPRRDGRVEVVSRRVGAMHSFEDCGGGLVPVNAVLVTNCHYYREADF